MHVEARGAVDAGGATPTWRIGRHATVHESLRRGRRHILSRREAGRISPLVGKTIIVLFNKPLCGAGIVFDDSVLFHRSQLQRELQICQHAIWLVGYSTSYVDKLAICYAVHIYNILSIVIIICSNSKLSEYNKTFTRNKYEQVGM